MIRLSIFRPEHPQTLASRHSLANAYRGAGQLDKAIPIYEQTIADRERILGPDHPNTLTSRNNLAGAYRHAGHLDKAIALYEQTFADRERILGPDHLKTVTSRNNLAGAYRAADKYDKAIPLYERALAGSGGLQWPRRGPVGKPVNVATGECRDHSARQCSVPSHVARLRSCLPPVRGSGAGVIRRPSFGPNDGQFARSAKHRSQNQRSGAGRSRAARQGRAQRAAKRRP
jgi:tetratricopeptide (TPR) repeat protein